jgi:hypothetical protein
MEQSGLGRLLLIAIGGLAVVACSFFIALKAVDYWSGQARSIKIEEASYGANCAASVQGRERDVIYREDL